MAFEQKQMQGLIITDPAKAKRQILDALDASGVHMGHAAKALDCTYVTLLRWIGKLGLTNAVETMKKKAIKAGTYQGRKGGRPVGSTVANGAAPRGSRASDRSDGARAR